MLKGNKWAFVGISVLLLAALACNIPGIGGGGASAEGKPTVTITSPPNNASAVLGQEMLIQSTATDTVGVVRVDLLVDETLVRSDTAPNPEGQTSFSLLQGWTPTTAGQHTIKVIAYRADGTASDPAIITVTVTEESAGTTATPTSSACTARTNTDLNVRTGPGTAYPILGVLGVGQTTTVTGRDGTNTWWQIAYPAGPGGSGWVSGAYVTLSGDCSAVPIGSYGAPPPTATPTITNTPEPGVTNTPQPPDLVVSSIDMPASITIIPAGSGTTVTIKVTVTNIGGQTATSFQTIVFPTGRGGAGGQLNLGTVASLPAGSSVTLQADYTYTVVGSYLVEAEVDSGKTVAEGDEGNNIRTLSVQASLFIPALTLPPIVTLAPSPTPTLFLPPIFTLPPIIITLPSP